MPQSLEDMLDGTQSAPPADVATLPEPKNEPQTGALPGPASGAAAAPAFSLPAPIASRMQAAGLKADGIDSHDKAYEYLLNQYEQTRPYADFGRTALASQPVGQGAQHEIPEQEAADEQQSEFDLDGHFNNLWSAPQLDAQAQFAIQNGLVQLGENGLYEAAPGFESMALPLLNSLNQAHVAQKQQMQKLFEGNFFSNVDNGLWPAMEYRFQKMLDERLNQRFQGYEQQQSAQGFEKDFVSQHKDWLYQGDQLSPKGNEFVQAVEDYRQELKKMGVKDPPPEHLAQYALMRIGGLPSTHAGSGQDAGRDAAAPAPTGDNRARDPKTGLYVKAGTPTPAPEPTKQESFLDAARRKAGLSSTQGGYTDADASVPANDGELENLWTNEWRKHTTGAAA